MGKNDVGACTRACDIAMNAVNIKQAPILVNYIITKMLKKALKKK